jgi:hypothetical protein
MPKFAVYYVPDAESDFYRLGTSILGYDVRAARSARMSPDVQERLGGFDPAWVERAQPYGFHLTIGDAIDFRLGDISAVEQEVKDLLNCFDPVHKFAVRRREEDFVTFWGAHKEVVVLRYDPNESLRLFHALVVARVHPLGIGSGYLQRFIQEPGQYAKRPHLAHKVRKFYSPTALDSYAPHFTLLNPYAGDDHDRLACALAKEFAPHVEMTVDSVCLLVQMCEEEEWIVYREFRRASHPEPFP